MKKLFKKYLQSLGYRLVPYSAEHKSLFGSHIPAADESPFTTRIEVLSLKK